MLPVIFGLVLGLAVFLTISGAKDDEYKDYKRVGVQVGQQHYRMYVADTPNLRAQGLSGKKSLPIGSGMMFVFDKPDQYGFWMKDMLFPIDIIWVSPDGKIIYMQENADPASYPTSFSPEEDALWVLEVPAGDAKKYNFSVGEKVEFITAK